MLTQSVQRSALPCEFRSGLTGLRPALSCPDPRLYEAAAVLLQLMPLLLINAEEMSQQVEDCLTAIPMHQSTTVIRYH